MLEIQNATTDDEIRACFPVIVQLRPHLDDASFLRRVTAQRAEGYELAFARDGEEIVAVAGYRFLRTLFAERFLYVDDLVTSSERRSRGYGAALLAWLEQRAREEECVELHLDSATHREGAHRFYKAHGMEILGYHFKMRL